MPRNIITRAARLGHHLPSGDTLLIAAILGFFVYIVVASSPGRWWLVLLLGICIGIIIDPAWRESRLYAWLTRPRKEEWEEWE